MKSPLRTIFVCLSILTLLGGIGPAKAGPFDSFFTALRKSFAHPTPRPRASPSHQSSRKQSNETPPSDASDDASNDSNSQTTPPRPTAVPAPPNKHNIRIAKATAAGKKRTTDMPYGIPVPGKQGLVTSPFSPDSGYIDVRNFPPGTQVKDPYTGKIFLTP